MLELLRGPGRRRLALGGALIAICSFAYASEAQALVIDPIFDSSITSNANASAIEAAINAAIGTIDGLYANPLNISTTFSYTPGAAGNLLETNQSYYDVTYSNYVAALKTDEAAHTGNTTLSTAIANLSKGNDSGGGSDLALTGAQLALLGLGAATKSNAVININSDQTFDFGRPVAAGDYDAIGGLEHELNEVLGGGGGGSTLNNRSSCGTTPTGFFCNKYGALDLYRYSAADTPSFSTSSTATSYLSVDGGTTKIVDFNQKSGGDFADFAPDGTGDGQLIQNAFNTTGQDEDYTPTSPEFAMLEAIGYDPVAEPSSVSLLLAALGSALWFWRRHATLAR